MANNYLDFEKPLVELERKIEELKNYANDKGINLNAEISLLEQKAEELKKETYQNLTPWQRIQLARHPERPNVMDYIERLFTDFLPLYGDRCYADDPAAIGGIACFEGQPVTIVGQLKGHNTKANIACNFGMLHPEGFIKSLRLIKQAEKFGRPAILFIDTPGAYSGVGAEERGQSWAIAKNLLGLAQVQTPIIVIIIGEGGSGGALACGVGDALLMLENAVFSVISPEGCAAILWHDASRSPEAAAALRLTSAELLAAGLIDAIIPEPSGGAHRDVNAAAENIRRELQNRLAELCALSLDDLITRREKRLRSIGVF